MDQPPVIPPTIPQVPPPIPSKNRKRLPLVLSIVLFLVFAFVAFLGFRVVQFALYVRKHPIHEGPGQAEFREADRQIIANKGTVAFGNSSKAIALAKDCHLNTNACVFLVHVPELRHFTSDAKKTMGDLAWINAQSVLKAKVSSPPKQVVVGVKGALLY